MNTLNRIKKTPVWKTIVQYSLIIIGILLYCFAWSVFLVPKHIIGGGVVGLASIIYYLTNIPMGITNFVINGVLLLMGCRVLGKMFGINTIIGMTTASLGLILFQQVLHIDQIPSFQFENMELVTRAILGGALSGLGIGLCLAIPAPAVEQSYASLDFFADGVGYLFVQAGHDCYLVGLFPSFDHKVYRVGINA